MNASKNKPLVFKKKVLRKIFGPENQTKTETSQLEQRTGCDEMYSDSKVEMGRPL